MKTLKIGLTGGMGCGKSAAADAFRKLGVEVLDADKLAHIALAENMCVRESLSKIFGEKAFPPDANPNRAEIAKIAFSDKEKLAALENALHPAINAMWLERLREIQASCDGKFSALVVEMPLLFEKGLEKNFDMCSTVFCREPASLKGECPSMISTRATPINCRSPKKYVWRRLLCLTKAILIFCTSKPRLH